MREYDIDFQPNELGCELGEAFAASLRPAIFDRDGATFDPAEFAQSLHKGSGPLALRRRRGRAQEPDGRRLARLLRARHKGPRSCRAAEKRDEIASSQTRARKLRSTGTKAKRGVARPDESQASLLRKLKAHACELENKLDARTRELTEAREHLFEAVEQQTATSEVLRVISSSPGELGPVFEAMLAGQVRRTVSLRGRYTSRRCAA
jgi:hypothetical protein